MARLIGLSEATYIGLHCMVLIKESGPERISIKKMAERLSVSEAHLAKVILRLSHSGLINTTRGPKGGAILAKAPEDISYLDIVESIEGDMEESGCMFGKRTCVYGSCVFGGFLAKVSGEAKKWLSANNLADLEKIMKEGVSL